MIRSCENHGYYDAAENNDCPICGGTGSIVLEQDRRVQLSKLLSGALRHFPEDLDLDPDKNGWVESDELVSAASSRYSWADSEEVKALIKTDPKHRFELRGDRVRATYGHSIEVDLDRDLGETPDVLYHGTAPENLDPIKSKGIQPMGRREVHLSPSRREAVQVGQRHSSSPAVVKVDAKRMRDDGFGIDQRSPTVYTVSRVPPQYILGVERDV